MDWGWVMVVGGMEDAQGFPRGGDKSSDSESDSSVAGFGSDAWAMDGGIMGQGSGMGSKVWSWWYRRRRRGPREDRIRRQNAKKRYVDMET